MTWPTARLGEVAEIERAGVDPTDLPASTRYLGLEHIERGGRIIGSQSVGEAAITSTKFRFDQRHVLFGKLRPNLGKVARPSFAGVCSTDILPILPGHRLDRDYIAHFLSQPSMVGYAAGLATGANLPRLSPSALAQFEVPVPDLEEQRRIAAILDQADALRAKRRQALARLDDLTQSIFLDMFGESRLGLVEAVSEIAAPGKNAIRTGPFGSQLLHSEFVPSGIAVLGLDNVVGNSFDWGERRYITPTKYRGLKRYTVSPGDVLISIMGTCGRCVVVPSDIPTAINTKHICAITPNLDKVLPEYLRAAFLWHSLCREYLQRQTKGSIMDGLNMGIIKAMPLPRPQIPDQQTFVEKTRAIERRSGALRSAEGRVEALVIALQARAFAGKL